MNRVPMTDSGFCRWPSENSHSYCGLATCGCSCHTEEEKK